MEGGLLSGGLELRLCWRSQVMLCKPIAVGAPWPSRELQPRGQ
jgi:hypothetical protein